MQFVNGAHTIAFTKGSRGTEVTTPSGFEKCQGSANKSTFILIK